MRVVSQFAQLGVGCSIVTMVVIVITAVRYGRSDDVDHDAWDPFPAYHFPHYDKEEPPIIKFLGSFTTWAFGFGAIKIVPFTRSNMKDKSGCIKAVVVSHSVVFLLYVAFVIPCLLGFSESALWSGDIVDLMNAPIVEPPRNADGSGTFVAYGSNGAAHPHKSWEAWVCVVCTIVSISITFPLIVRILTRMGEDSIPKLAENAVVGTACFILIAILVI